MTELDLADTRARLAADKGMGYEARCDTIRLCDALDAARLENARLTKVILGDKRPLSCIAEREVMRPVVAAARALDSIIWEGKILIPIRFQEEWRVFHSSLVAYESAAQPEKRNDE